MTGSNTPVAYPVILVRDLICFAVLIAWLVVCFGIAARYFGWQ